MALPRLDLLIRDARDATGNRDYTSDSGVQQRVFVRHANAAQSRIFNLIANERSTLSTYQDLLDVTAGVASITLPTDVHLKHNVRSVQYSPNGDVQLFAPLEQVTPRAEVSVNGYPTGYFFRDGAIVLTPKPSQTAVDALRIEYQRTIPTIDIRRGLVSAHGLTSITLTDNSTLITETSDDLANGWVDYISVVDKDGTQIATAIPVTSYASTTRVITCTLTAAQNTAITNGSHYVVFGKNATTNSSLVEPCDRYITTYMDLLVKVGDSNATAVMTNPVLQAIEAEIIESVAMLEEDIFTIPVLDYTYIESGCE